MSRRQRPTPSRPSDLRSRLAGSAAVARSLTVVAVLSIAWTGCGSPPAHDPAGLVVFGQVWTGHDDPAAAGGVAVEAGRIVAVGSRPEIEGFVGPETRVIDAGSGFVAPGFIDNHTHFNRAGELLVGVNLLDVASPGALADSVRAARDRLPEDAWIVGGSWGAYEEWARGSTGRGKEASAAKSEGGTPFRPNRSMIDSVTPGSPVLLSRWDRSVYLANGRALELAGADCGWSGVECEAGRPTGRLTPEAADRIREVIPPKTMEQRLVEARAGLRRLAESGVTTIHDITPPEQMKVFQILRRRGELTTRVYARTYLDRWDELQAAGLEHGFGDDRLTVGGLKGFVDGIMGNSSARFYEPYLTTGERGSWRRMMTEPPGMQELLIGADTAGHWPQVHAIGDQAIDTLLSMFERAMERNGERGGVRLEDGGEKERRWRVIHAQVLSGPEVADRMARLGVIAEVQPYHAIDDMRWMEERIGADRSRWAYAFRTLREAGVRLSFGSDWPGTNAAWYPTSPVLGIYAAVTRQTLDGEPEGGWFPEERVSPETALRAYTVNNAYAEGTEDRKGQIRSGYLADLVILDRSPLQVQPSAIQDLRVLYTVMDGEVTYRAPELSPGSGDSGVGDSGETTGGS